MKNSKKIFGIVIVLFIVTLAILPLLFNDETEVINETVRGQTTGSYIELSHGITHYEIEGPDTAKTVLLVPGFSVPYYLWDPTFEALIESGFRVIRFDYYGRGFSDRPDVVYNQNLFTQQIFDLLESLKINDPIDIVGVSMGGPVTAEFVVNNPEKVNKVILIDPVHEAVKISILSTPGLGEYMLNVYFAPSLPNRQLEDFYSHELYTYWPEKFKEQMKYKGFKRAILSTLRNYMNEDKLEQYIKLGELQKPVLLIWGEADVTCPIDRSDRIREVVECKFLRIEKAGHIPHIEKPEIVNTQIVNFLNN